ncbi:MAG: serpin family protein, partial [Actinomycetota bacterium]
EVDLETRVPVPVPDPSGSNPDDPGELTVRLANAAYLQQGYPFRADYLETIGTHYGPVLREVDFAPDPDAVARAINGFVAENTEDLITDLIGEGVLTIDTVLVLVNALYLDATWVRPFDEELTAAAPFTTADGTEVTVDLMVSVSDSVARGDGWIGATKAYSGGLEAQFVLPDEGKFNDVADSLDEVFATFDKPPDGQRVPDQLAAPRFEIRANLELDPALRSLGLEAVYQRGGLLGMANDGRLVLHKTIHETYVRLDESGTEAAAATAGTVRLTSAGGPKPLPVMLDRPFLYRIVDTHSGATLFIGQVTDPTAG